MNRQSGFTLIEVLVAFLVMAIGLLGVIGLQNTAMRSNFNSSSQMQAVLLAKEMADMMRATPQAVNDGDYDEVSGSAVSACSSGTSGCTPAEMAQYNKAEWDAHVTESLGADAAGVVCIDSTPDDGTGASAAACDGSGRTWAIKLWWNEGAQEAETYGLSETTATALSRDDTPEGPSYFMSFTP